VPFREFGYIPEGPDKNDNYKQANVLSNLICLCPHHHKLVEHGSITIQSYNVMK
jgi:predicted restriction endonuclease